MLIENLPLKRSRAKEKSYSRHQINDVDKLSSVDKPLFPALITFTYTFMTRQIHALKCHLQVFVSCSV